MHSTKYSWDTRLFDNIENAEESTIIQEPRKQPNIRILDRYRGLAEKGRISTPIKKPHKY